jgi:hypothetical protein
MVVQELPVSAAEWNFHPVHVREQAALCLVISPAVCLFRLLPPYFVQYLEAIQRPEVTWQVYLQGGQMHRPAQSFWHSMMRSAPLEGWC